MKTFPRRPPRFAERRDRAGHTSLADGGLAPHSTIAHGGCIGAAPSLNKDPN